MRVLFVPRCSRGRRRKRQRRIRRDRGPGGSANVVDGEQAEALAYAVEYGVRSLPIGTEGIDAARAAGCLLETVPNWRRREIGLKLVRSGEARLRARGARRISALVAETDEAAASLWRAARYSLDENVGRFVRNV